MSAPEPLAPLRRIVRVERGEWVTRETLECGHTVNAHGSFARRRRCGQCLRGVPATPMPGVARTIDGLRSTP